VRVMVATKPVDFRKGAEGLAALVREEMKADPFSGAVHVFRAKRADRVKLIYWDGTGVCLLAKRLEDGKFRWPNVQDSVMRLSGCGASGFAGRARLAADSRGARDAGTDAAGMIAAQRDASEPDQHRSASCSCQDSGTTSPASTLSWPAFIAWP
jgi:transposase